MQKDFASYLFSLLIVVTIIVSSFSFVLVSSGDVEFTYDGVEYVIKNRVLVITGEDLVVKENSHIKIINSSIYFNSSTGIKVENSIIEIENSILQPLEQEDSFSFYVENSTLIIKNSTISKCNTAHNLIPRHASIKSVNSRLNITKTIIIESGAIYGYNSTIYMSDIMSRGSIWFLESDKSNTTLLNTDIKTPHLFKPSDLPPIPIRIKGGMFKLQNVTLSVSDHTMPGRSLLLINTQAMIKGLRLYMDSYNINGIYEGISSGIKAYKSNITIIDTVIQRNIKNSNYKLTAGVLLKESYANMSYTQITGAGIGVWLENSYSLLEKSIITNNSIGIYVVGDKMNNSHIHYSNIYNNNRYGIFLDSQITLNATLNYWGVPEGPSIDGVKAGDKIVVKKGEIIYNPWLEEPVNIRNFSQHRKVHQLNIVAPIIIVSYDNQVVPGVSFVETIDILNAGTENAEVLIALLNPFNITILKIGGADLVLNSSEVTVLHTSIEEQGSKRLFIKLRVPPERVFGENHDLQIGGEYFSPIPAILAALDENEWNTIVNISSTPSELINNAWRKWMEIEESFYSDMSSMSFDNQAEILNLLEFDNPLLYRYITWLLFTHSIRDREVFEPLGFEETVTKAELSLSPIYGNMDVYKNIQGYVKNVVNKENLGKAWSWYKGYWKGLLKWETNSKIDMSTGNQAEEMGKVFGYNYAVTLENVASNIGLLLLGATQPYGGRMPSGIKNINFFTTIGSKAQYPTLLGIEAEYETGVYGNIVKIASNPRFGGWYLGFGHVVNSISRVQTPAGTKLIFRGWGHWYFFTGKLAVWSEEAATYQEFYGYFLQASMVGGKYLYKTLNDAFNGPNQDPFEITTSTDPNRFTASPQIISSPDTEITCTVYFENMPNATAPAHNISIIIPIDKSLNYSTVKLVSTSHPDYLDIFKIEEGYMNISFKGIDLPPNKNPPEGEGWIKFTITPRKDIGKEAVIKENASIKFDYNPWIRTNDIAIIYDAQPPITEISGSLVNNSIILNVSSTDNIDVDSVVVMIGDNSTGKIYTYTLPPNESLVFPVNYSTVYWIMGFGIDKAGNVESKDKPDLIINANTETLSNDSSTGLWDNMKLVVVFMVLGVVLGYFVYRYYSTRRENDKDTVTP